MQLLPKEQIIKQSQSDSFTITNLRVIQNYKNWLGNRYQNYIYLEDISSAEGKLRGHIIFLILGIILGLAGLYTSFMEPASGASILILGGIFAAIWWFTRKIAIVVKPNGGSPMVITIKAGDKMMNQVLFDIQLAKMNRVHHLHNANF